MPSTYIQLCNQTLRRLNEVEIADADFGSVRGVHALVKDAIKAAIAKINQAHYEWPFNAAQETVVLSIGQEEYVWPEYFKVADWNSFQLQKDEGLGVNYKSLKFISRDEWYANHRDADYESGATGRGSPLYIFPSHGNGWGVSPSPQAAYSITFRYYLNYSDITNATDVSRIPQSYDSVLIDGALYHMYMFKDNMEAAIGAYRGFEQGMKDLENLYTNTNMAIRDTRVRY